MTERAARYLSVEQPDRQATVDFLDCLEHCGCTVRIRVEDGMLWVTATANTPDAPILIDQLVDLPQRDEADDDCDSPDADEENSCE